MRYLNFFIFISFWSNLHSSAVEDEVFNVWSVNGESYFRDEYDQSRENFIESARRIGANLHQIEIVKGLFTDVAILKRDNKKILLHLSGVHGVEGYAGSAIQAFILDFIRGEADNYQLPTIIFVHAVNPYGMKNNRRVNEDNIDLNRNFLYPEDFQRVIARNPNFAGYEDLDFLFNPTSSPIPLDPAYYSLQKVYASLKSAYGVLRFGLQTMKRAMVSGNYFKQTGLGFGGFALSRSAQSLIDFFGVPAPSDDSSGSDSDPYAEVSEVVVIDVHTGLGPAGVDTLGTSVPAQERPAFEAAFPTDFVCVTSRWSNARSAVGGLKSYGFSKSGGEGEGEGEGGGSEARPPVTGGSDALSGYELMEGDTCGGLTRKFLFPAVPADKKLCMVQEFGTISTVAVGQALVLENFAHFYGTTPKTREFYGERLKDAFYLQDTAWKRRVVRRGAVLFLQALKRLGYTGADRILEAYHKRLQDCSSEL